MTAGVEIYNSSAAFVKSVSYTHLDVYKRQAHNGGGMISQKDLKQGIEPFYKIRDAVGDSIEIMCELHSLWSLPAAITICQALEPYHIFWAEDPICKMDDSRALQILRSQTSTPICGSETLAGAVTFRQMLEQNTLDYIMADLSWSGVHLAFHASSALFQEVVDVYKRQAY